MVSALCIYDSHVGYIVFISYSWFVLKQETRGRRQYQEKAEETDYE